MPFPGQCQGQCQYQGLCQCLCHRQHKYQGQCQRRSYRHSCCAATGAAPGAAASAATSAAADTAACAAGIDCRYGPHPMWPEWGSLLCCHRCQGSEPEQAEDCSGAIAAGTTANIAAGAASSLDRPVGFCCGGSGVWPLLPTPSEAADASLYCVRESTGAFLMTEKCSHT